MCVTGTPSVNYTEVTIICLSAMTYFTATTSLVAINSTTVKTLFAIVTTSLVLSVVVVFFVIGRHTLG